MHSRNHESRHEKNKGLGLDFDSTKHNWPQSQPKLGDLAYNHLSNNKHNIQFNKHSKPQNSQEQERRIEIKEPGIQLNELKVA